MEEIDYNFMKQKQNNLLPQNKVLNYNRQKFIPMNHYPEKYNEEDKLNINKLRINYTNKPIKPEINFNQNIISQSPIITNYYSYQTTKMNFKDKNPMKNYSLMEQYSRKDNLQSKYYLDYLQKRRNTNNNYQDKKSELDNIIRPNIQRMKAIYTHNNDNNNNFSYKKNLLMNRLNSSKSAKDLLLGNEHDILIEYENIPIMQTKRNTEDNYINSCSNDSISYIINNLNNKNRKDFSYNLNEESEIRLNSDNFVKNTNEFNYKSYIANNINKNKNVYNKTYFDINRTDINSNEFTKDEKKYNFLIGKKNQILKKSNDYSNLTTKMDNSNNNKSTYTYKIPLKNVKIKNDNILGFNNNKKPNNLNNINSQSIKEYNSSTAKKDYNNKNKNIMNIPRKKISNININKRKINLIKKDLINNKNNNIKYNKSKIDIFSNKDYGNKINYQKKWKKINSPSFRRNIFDNKSNCKKINIKDNDKNNASLKQILESQHPNDSNKKKKNSNKRSINNRQKLLIFNNHKTNNLLDVYNSVESNYNLSYRLEKSYDDKRSNLTECYMSQDNKNIPESKHNTSRCVNSKTKDENLIFLTGNTNNYEYKSSNTMSKNENKTLNNNSQYPNYFTDYYTNIVNNIDNNYKIINIDFKDYNSQYDYNLPKNNVSQILSNKKENLNEEKIYKINNNLLMSNDKFLKNGVQKYMINNNVRAYSKLKNKEDCNNQLKSIPLKLYLLKKDNNNLLKQINISNNNSNNNKNRKCNSLANNNNIKNNNIIHINNNTSNVNVVNLKNSSINICIDKKNKFNIFPQEKKDYINSSINKEINIYKSNKINLKNVENELYENNKNLKNLKNINSIINKTISNYNNQQNDLKFSTNTIRYNKSFNINKKENDNNTKEKSYKNILNKSNVSENNNNIINKRKLIVNNSEIFLLNKNKLNSEYNSSINRNAYFNNITRKKNLNNNNNRKDQLNNNKYENRGLVKTIISPEREKNNINIINYYKKINIPLISTNNSIQLNAQNINQIQSTKDIKGIYIKPYRILAMSKPKKNILKSKSELKININTKKNDSINKKDINYSLKEIKNEIKRLKSEIQFNTYAKNFRKDEDFKNNLKNIRKCNVRSVNESYNSNNISTLNNNENNSIETKNDNNLDNKIIIKNIREPFQKNYCFFSKYYNYFITIQKIEKCHFVKGKRNNINKNIIKGKNIIVDLNQKISMVQENNEEEKNNESSQNGLVMTFGEMNNKKNNEKSYTLNNINNNIVNINDNIIEDSELEFYKSLQQGSTQNQNDKLSNEYTNLKIYESMEKDKNNTQNYENEIFKSNEGGEIDDDYNNKKSKTYKSTLKCNLENVEKGLEILGKIAQRSGINGKDEPLNFEDSDIHSKDNQIIKNDKILLGTNKLYELFNSRKETEPSNYDQKDYENYNNKNKTKCYRTVNKESINNNKIESNEKKKINTYNAKISLNKEGRILDNSEYDILDFSGKNRTNFGSTNSKNAFDSYFNEINNDNSKLPRSKESEILLNKTRNDAINSKEVKYSLLPGKNNIFNDEIFNQENNLFSYSEEDLKSDNLYNLKVNKEEFQLYLTNIKKLQDNNIKHDIIFLFNILVWNNYGNILNKITKKLLYKDDVLNNNINIIKNEHLFINIIFKEIEKGKKYIEIYAKLCNDLNNNLYNELNEQKNIKNNKERNLKLIINEECISYINDLKNLKVENNIKENEVDYYYLKIKIINFSIFINELIKIELLKPQFGIYVIEQFYKIYNNNINNIIKDSYLEAIIIFLEKFGKFVFDSNNNKLIQNINNYIYNNLKNNIQNKISNYLKYRIMNLITKLENKWKDNLSEMIKKEENSLNLSLVEQQNEKNSKINNNNMRNKIWNKKINIDDVNKSIIEEDLANYIQYFSEENSKGEINLKTNFDKSYNWKIIEELINDKNFGLESIIKNFIIVCSNIINGDNQILLSNDYIKNIIEYYVNNLTKKEIDNIHSEMIKMFLKIDEIIIKNKNMYKILGNLLFILIDNKLYLIKYFNHYLKVERQTQINLAIITRYCILSSGKFAKKYFNDFKQTKLFNNNEIFVTYINEPLKDLLYFFK